MCMYVCVCACGSSRGRAEKAFALYLQTVACFYAAGPCRRWQCRGLPGWLRGVTLLQRNKTQLQGRASEPSTRLHPPTTTTRRRGGGGDFSIRHCITLSPVQTREKNERNYHYSPSRSLNILLHLPPSLLLGLENQKICRKLQNKLKKKHFLKKVFTRNE